MLPYALDRSQLNREKWDRHTFRGLAAAGGMYLISLLLEDTLRTALAGVAIDRIVRSCIYQSIVCFTLAFVGAFIARRNFLAAITLVALVCILVTFNNFLQNFAMVGERPSDIELLIKSAPVILAAITSIIAGAFAGKMFSHTGSASDSETRYARRKKVLFLSMLGLCVIAPQAYSAYWFAEAQNETRNALISIKSGRMPENVRLARSLYGDEAVPIDHLVEEFSTRTKVKTSHKYGLGHHGYEVKLFIHGEPPYVASASYSYGEWNITCCYQF